MRVSAILVRSGKAGVREERIDVAFPVSGVFYQLAGTAQNRSIPGQATLARGQLVRREALELAFYTFHSMPQTDYVVAFMPPPAGVPQQSPLFNRAVLLPRAGVQARATEAAERRAPAGRGEDHAEHPDARGRQTGSKR